MENEEEVSEIINKPEYCLMLSSMHCRYPEHEYYLSGLGVDIIFDLSGNKGLKRDHPNIQYVVYADVEDSHHQILFPFMSAIYDDIRSRVKVSQKQLRVLVHCRQGISRSAAVMIYLMMKMENMKLKDAFRYVKEKRRIILPNIGFIKELIRIEAAIFHSTSMQVGEQGQFIFLPDQPAEGL